MGDPWGDGDHGSPFQNGQSPCVLALFGVCVWVWEEACVIKTPLISLKLDFSCRFCCFFKNINLWMSSLEPRVCWCWLSESLSHFLLNVRLFISVLLRLKTSHQKITRSGQRSYFWRISSLRVCTSVSQPEGNGREMKHLYQKELFISCRTKDIFKKNCRDLNFYIIVTLSVSSICGHVVHCFFFCPEMKVINCDNHILIGLNNWIVTSSVPKSHSDTESG